MASETLARRYATAVFELALEARAVPQVGRDLHAIAAMIEAQSEAKAFFLAPIIDRKNKERVLRASFAGMHELALHLVLLLVRKRREALLREVVEQYDVLERRSRGARTLVLTTAKPLAARERDETVARLEKIYGERFDVQEQVEPRLIGGLRITMDDRRVDGSVEGRLEDLSRTLFARN